MSRTRSDAIRSIQRSIASLSAGPDHRRAGRVNVKQLKCNLGRVVELSSGGVRLLSRRKLRGRHEIRLFDSYGGVRIETKVVWSKRRGLWKHEIGLQFLNITSDIAAKLTTLATNNRT